MFCVIMEVFRRYYILLLMCLTAMAVEAQYDVSFGHYWAMEPSFNPAAVD